MATALPIFVSHSHEDKAFCQSLVTALRNAGADVWYDEHNMESGNLMDVIMRELDRRKIFIVILSKNAFASRWVRKETGWAYELAERDPTRVILPVTAAPIERSDFGGANGWLFLHDYKRIEAPGFQPLPLAETIGRVLHALALTPAGEAPAPTAPQPTESVDDLITRGKRSGDRANTPRRWPSSSAPPSSIPIRIAPGSTSATHSMNWAAMSRRSWPMIAPSTSIATMQLPGTTRAMRSSVCSANRLGSSISRPMSRRWPSTPRMRMPGIARAPLYMASRDTKRK